MMVTVPTCSTCTIPTSIGHVKSLELEIQLPEIATRKRNHTNISKGGPSLAGGGGKTTSGSNASKFPTVCSRFLKMKNVIESFCVSEHLLAIDSIVCLFVCCYIK